MRKILFAIIIAVSFIVIICTIIILLSSKQISEETDPKIDSSKNLKGLSFTPKEFTESGVADFFSKTKECCEVITAGVDVSEIENQSTGAVFVTKTAPVNKLKTVVIIGFDLWEEKYLENYRNLIVTFVDKYDPDFLSIGNEVNNKFDNANMSEFIEFFNQTYDEIRAINSEVQIFTIFQLEKLRGLNGGLFGGKNNTLENQWELLNKFNKADLLGFTSYPGLIFKNPEDITKNYWVEINDYTDKAISFTEVGWFKDSPSEEWQSSEEEQGEFIKSIPSLTGSLNMKFIVWPFVYDLEKSTPPFTKMGLINRDSSTSINFNAWSSLLLP